MTIYASRPPSTHSAQDDGHHATGWFRTAAGQSARACHPDAAGELLPPTRPFFASILHPLEYWLRVAAISGREAADVVHIFNYSQALPVLRRLTGAKLVLHMHCEWLSQLDARMIDRRLRHADLIVGCSDHITISSVSGSRNTRPLHERSTTAWRRDGADRSRTLRREVIELLNVGRVSPEKGLHVLVDALEHVVRKAPAGPADDSRRGVASAARVRGQDRDRPGGQEPRAILRRAATCNSFEHACQLTFRNRVDVRRSRRHTRRRCGYYRDADIFVYPVDLRVVCDPARGGDGSGRSRRCEPRRRHAGDSRARAHGLARWARRPGGTCARDRRLIESPASEATFGEAGALRAERDVLVGGNHACLESAYDSLLDRHGRSRRIGRQTSSVPRSASRCRR